MLFRWTGRHCLMSLAFMAAGLGCASNALAAPKCLAPVASGMSKNSDEVDYLLTDKAGLNEILINVADQTVLSNLTCRPDPESGAVYVVVSAGWLLLSDTLEKSVENGVSRKLTSASSGPVAMSEVAIHGFRGLEAFAPDVSAQGAPLFRYSLLVQLDGEDLISIIASGPADEYATLREKFHRIASGIKLKANSGEAAQRVTDALERSIRRLREPLLEAAIRACLSNPFTAEQGITQAQSEGFPAFKTQTISGLGEWSVSLAPPDDSGKITLAMQSDKSAGKLTRRCLILGPSPFTSFFKSAFETRFGGADGLRAFSVANGQVTAGGAGANAVIPQGGGVGVAKLHSDDTRAEIVIEVTGPN